MLRHRALAVAIAALVATRGRRRSRGRRATAARRQRLELRAERRAPAARRARPRHVREPLEQLAGALAAAEGQRLLHLRARLGSYHGSGLLGFYGVGDIPTSAGQLDAFVDRVRAASGAPEVDLVGHSQGGMMPRWYLKFRGGASEVPTLVGLSPSNHGTTLNGLFLLPGSDAFAASWPACRPGEGRLGVPAAAQRGRRHGRRRHLHGDPDPLRRGRHAVHVRLLSGPEVTNTLLQDQDPANGAEHVTIPYDPLALADTLAALQ
jgi:hypothetical protein